MSSSQCQMAVLSKQGHTNMSGLPCKTAVSVKRGHLNVSSSQCKTAVLAKRAHRLMSSPQCKTAVHASQQYSPLAPRRSQVGRLHWHGLDDGHRPAARHNARQPEARIAEQRLPLRRRALAPEHLHLWQCIHAAIANHIRERRTLCNSPVLADLWMHASLNHAWQPGARAA